MRILAFHNRVFGERLGPTTDRLTKLWPSFGTVQTERQSGPKRHGLRSQIVSDETVIILNFHLNMVCHDFQWLANNACKRRTAGSVTPCFEWTSQTLPARMRVETPTNVPAIASLTKCQSPAIGGTAAMSSSAKNNNSRLVMGITGYSMRFTSM